MQISYVSIIYFYVRIIYLLCTHKFSNTRNYTGSSACASSSICIHIKHLHTIIATHKRIYIYIYIYRERERERDFAITNLHGHLCIQLICTHPEKKIISSCLSLSARDKNIFQKLDILNIAYLSVF